MSVEAKLDELLTAVKAITPTTPTDNTAVLAAIEAVSGKVDALATVIGTETPVTAPPTA